MADYTMDETKPSGSKKRMFRCMDWLQKQNSLEPTKLSLQNKNDIQFIIQTNTERKNFLLAAAEDDATVPVGVSETLMEPQAVSLRKLRVCALVMECEWLSCKKYFTVYEEYQKHVWKHASDLKVTEIDNTDEKDKLEYECQWDVCGHKNTDYEEMVRHMNYHAYHGKLLAIGFNGRATLKLVRCRKDSSKRNKLPLQPSDYVCMWHDCDRIFNSMQNFLDHVKVHTNYADSCLCSWAGCGAQFSKKVMLSVHVRTHTGERLIACYHCGQHFANNRKLCDHLRRQNVHPHSPYVCGVCGCVFASAYLLSEHTRQHVSTYACSYCDMSAHSPSALAHHVRYRHLNNTRHHACPHCSYKAITKSDLHVHVLRHKKKKKTKSSISTIEVNSDEENSDVEEKKQKTPKKYVCHMCQGKQMKIFSRGTRLTTHLVKVHGAQWSFGHSRFRYQICNDGMYRLTTTRLESIEVSRKIMDGHTDPTGSLTNLDFDIKKVSDATDRTPRHFEIILKKENGDSDLEDNKICKQEYGVEITMCDVDDKGNIISSEVIKSAVMYST